MKIAKFSEFSQTQSGWANKIISHLRKPLYRNGYALIINSISTSILGVLYWVIAARFYATEAVGINAATISTMTFLSSAARFYLDGALIRFLPGRRLPYLRFIGRFGDEIDVERSRLGHGSSFEVYASAQPVDHLQAELIARGRRLEIDGDRLFSAESVRAQLTWTFGQRSFVRGIGDARTVDWNRALAPEKPKREGSIDTSLLYGFRLNWQTILYAGYADTRPVYADGAGDANREYFLKVSYALRPGESDWFRRDATNDDEHPVEIGGTL